MDSWSPLPQGSFKLNFDGPSKGNLGQAGFGGAFRNDRGQICNIYYTKLGLESNNAAELMGLLQGIISARNQGLLPLIMEGNSALILSMATKLQNGSSNSKVSFSWRLEYELQQLANLLSEPMAITFQHVRC